MNMKSLKIGFVLFATSFQSFAAVNIELKDPNLVRPIEEINAFVEENLERIQDYKFDRVNDKLGCFCYTLRPHPTKETFGAQKKLWIAMRSSDDTEIMEVKSCSLVQSCKRRK